LRNCYSASIRGAAINKIVRKNHPTSRLPEDLRPSNDLNGRVTATVGLKAPSGMAVFTPDEGGIAGLLQEQS